MYQQPYQPYYPPPRRTNTLAIVSLVCAFVFAPAGIVLGIMARKEIRRTGEDGWGLATAGMIISIGFTLLSVLMIIVWFVMMAVLWSKLPPQ